MVNLKKSIPETLASCKCLCCTDCAYGDGSSINQITFVQECDHRQKLIRKQYNKMGKLGV